MSANATYWRLKKQRKDDCVMHYCQLINNTLFSEFSKRNTFLHQGGNCTKHGVYMVRRKDKRSDQ